MLLHTTALRLLWDNCYLVDRYFNNLYLWDFISFINYKKKPIRIFVIFYFYQAWIRLFPWPELWICKHLYKVEINKWSIQAEEQKQKENELVSPKEFFPLIFLTNEAFCFHCQKFIANICSAEYHIKKRSRKKILFGVHFLLCMINIYSKYAWVILLRDKKVITITNAIQILDESKHKPNKIWVNKGNKF